MRRCEHCNSIVNDNDIVCYNCHRVLKPNDDNTNNAYQGGNNAPYYQEQPQYIQPMGVPMQQPQYGQSMGVVPMQQQPQYNQPQSNYGQMQNLQITNEHMQYYQDMSPNISVTKVEPQAFTYEQAEPDFGTIQRDRRIKPARVSSVRSKSKPTYYDDDDDVYGDIKYDGQPIISSVASTQYIETPSASSVKTAYSIIFSIMAIAILVTSVFLNFLQFSNMGYKGLEIFVSIMPDSITALAPSGYFDYMCSGKASINSLMSITYLTIALLSLEIVNIIAMFTTFANGQVIKYIVVSLAIIGIILTAGIVLMIITLYGLAGCGLGILITGGAFVLQLLFTLGLY